MSEIQMCKMITLGEAIAEQIKVLRLEDSRLREDLLYQDFRDDRPEVLLAVVRAQLRSGEIKFLLSHLEPLVGEL